MMKADGEAYQGPVRKETRADCIWFSVTALLVFVLSLLLLVLGLPLLPMQNVKNFKGKTENGSEAIEQIQPAVDVKVVPRAEWEARDPFLKDKLHPPVSLVVFNPTHPIRFPWWDKEKKYKILRDLQQFHMYQKLMPDVQYNFMIDEMGTIYEGRGWKFKPSATPGDRKANLNSIYIGYIGDINEEGPSDEQMKAGNDLISYGMKYRYIMFHHHIAGMIMGIVGTTQEECASRVNLPELEKKEAPPKPPQPMDQFMY